MKDEDGEIYSIGAEVAEEDMGMYLYPVSLDGEDIFNITFDEKTIEIYDFKDKSLMFDNGEEPHHIKSIDYVGVY